MKAQKLCDECGKEYAEPEIGLCLNCFLGRSSEDRMQEIFTEKSQAHDEAFANTIFVLYKEFT